jgi:glutamine synthetase|tara:strand:- start:1023 stop:2159 length:1137 start_codon:yes stop_codon:yes gene_type:complete
MKIKLEYIWLDGYSPEPNLRSKVKVVDAKLHEVKGKKLHGVSLNDCPQWGFDGSSTKQAEGNFSDCTLNPVRLYPNPLNKGMLDSYLVFCEVLNPDGLPHDSNTRALLGGDDETDLWFGFEQEYTIMKEGKPIGFPKDGFPEPQGKYYCGVGNGQVNGRLFVEQHMENCIMAGIEITGINAEVMLGQWEYQVLGKGKLKSGDDLWVSRYILNQMSEDYGFNIEYHPKPVTGDWNGSGLHCNFSNTKMREEGGKQYFDAIFKTFESRHIEHIKCYGSSNDMRLTGEHETQSIHKFSWGVSDRGASIRVPISTEKEWKGYVEDRRPASNADPYRIINIINESIINSEELYKTLHNMYSDVKVSDEVKELIQTEPLERETE